MGSLGLCICWIKSAVQTEKISAGGLQRYLIHNLSNKLFCRSWALLAIGGSWMFSVPGHGQPMPAWNLTTTLPSATENSRIPGQMPWYSRGRMSWWLCYFCWAYREDIHRIDRHRRNSLIPCQSAKFDFGIWRILPTNVVCPCRHYYPTSPRLVKSPRTCDHRSLPPF